ncbi:23260_t:CDS:2 [Cetraspora pellucida]|uniref:23260_t:CDS:1 n=1 Tax=Cetraspora pellucida TaxID=1433469 RepID=A0A9N9D602_9GLOM|nr:23260_t:CDS:2 [Cetraspora pellucida]
MSNWFKVAIEQKYITLFEYDSFQDWKVIGKGGFGAVYSAYSRDAEKTIALKSLYCDDNDIPLDGFIKEIRNINRVAHHDNIVRFFGITQVEIRNKLNYIRMAPAYHSEKDISIGISNDNYVDFNPLKPNNADNSIQDMNSIG